jgi:hypothetical protein
VRHVAVVEVGVEGWSRDARRGGRSSGGKRGGQRGDVADEVVVAHGEAHTMVDVVLGAAGGAEVVAEGDVQAVVDTAAVMLAVVVGGTATWAGSAATGGPRRGGESGQEAAGPRREGAPAAGKAAAPRRLRWWSRWWSPGSRGGRCSGRRVRVVGTEVAAVVAVRSTSQSAEWSS